MDIVIPQINENENVDVDGLYPVIRTAQTTPSKQVANVVYSEIITPSAPTLEEIELGNVSANTANVPDDMVIEYNTKKKCYQLWLLHWREFISILPGLILIFANGVTLHMYIQTLLRTNNVSLWSIGDQQNKDAVILPLQPIVVSFLGAILGTMLGFLLVTRKSKCFIYATAAVSLTIAGTCLTNDYRVNVVTTGHFLLGFVYGLAHLTTVIHVSDITSKPIRDFALKFISTIIAASITISSLINLASIDISANGKLLRALGGCALISILFTKESISFLVAQLRYEKALIQITAYRGESVPSVAAISSLDVLKSKINADIRDGENIIGPSYIRSECITLGISILHVLCSNVPMTMIMFSSIDHLLTFYPKLGEYPKDLIYGVVLFTRLFCGCIVFLVTKPIKRIPLYCNLAIINGIGLLLTLTPLNTNTNYLHEFAFVFFATNIFMEFGLNALLYDQISERFTYANRPWAVASIEFIAKLLEVILVLLFLAKWSGVVMGVSGLALVLISILLRNISKVSTDNIIV